MVFGETLDGAKETVFDIGDFYKFFVIWVLLDF
jgi:hypothetical protein